MQVDYVLSVTLTAKYEELDTGCDMDTQKEDQVLYFSWQ